jgi:acetyl-CoA decarbonylase/synthase complex subunit gamma
MNFTGSSTFTSLSGVQKEMKTALPIQIGAAALGIIGWIITRFI